MHLYVWGVGFATFYDFDILFWNCSDSVVFLCIITRLTRWVPHVEQELLTLPEHLSSPPVFSSVCVARSLVFCVVFCISLFVLLSFISFDLCIVCPSSIYGFWLPLWYLLTFLTLNRFNINQP